MTSYRFKNSKNRNKSYTPNTTTRHIASEDKSFEEARIQDEIQLRFGFERYDEGPERLGWLLNMNQVKKVIETQTETYFCYRLW